LEEKVTVETVRNFIALVRQAIAWFCSHAILNIFISISITALHLHFEIRCFQHKRVLNKACVEHWTSS
jgi:hypothetical protein